MVKKVKNINATKLQIGKNIELIRLLADKTQKEFAAFFTGISVAMLKSYEGNKAKPSSLFIDELAEFAGITTDDLLHSTLKKSQINLSINKVDKVDKGTDYYEKASIIVIKQYLAKVLANSDDYDKVQSCLNEIEARTSAEMKRLLQQLKNTVS